MNRLVLTLCPLIFLLVLPIVMAQQQVDIQVYQNELPYTDVRTVEILSTADVQASVQYDTWLSGAAALTFGEAQEELDVFIAVPSGTAAGNFTRTVSVKEANTSTPIADVTFNIVVLEQILDSDLDGWPQDEDCNDNNQSVHPNAQEVLYNGADDDCDASTQDTFALSSQLVLATVGLADPLQIQVNAAPSAIVTVDICEAGIGFVPCFFPIRVAGPFPTTQSFPYTNKTGSFTATVTMSVNGYVQTQRHSFRVVDDILANLDAPSLLRVNEAGTFTAQPRGGSEPYTVAWTLSTGGTFSGNSASMSFGSKGTHSVTVTIRDKYDNVHEEVVSVIVKETQPITISVIDAVTGSGVIGAQVSVDEETHTTDSSGNVVFHLIEDMHRVVAIHAGYKPRSMEIDVTKPSTFVVELGKSDSKGPGISWLSPTSGATLSAPRVEMRAAVSEDSQSVCTLFMSQAQASLAEIASIDVEPGQQVNYPLDVDPAQYHAKIECSDAQGNKGSTPEITFVVAAPGETVELAPLEDATAAEVQTFTQEESGIPLDRVNILDAIGEAQTRVTMFDSKEQQAASALGFDAAFRNVVRSVERTARDLNDIGYRTDISEQERVAKQRELNDKLDAQLRATPIDLHVIKHTSFVKYVREPDLEKILPAYYGLQGEGIASAVDKQQQAYKVSTDVKTVTLTYLDGNSKDITLVVDTVTHEGSFPSKTNVVIAIPSEGTSPITPLNTTIQTKNGYHFLAHDTAGELVYYLDGEAMSAVDKHHVVMLSEIPPKKTSRLSGAAILSISSGTNRNTVLLILAGILAIAYLLYAFDGTTWIAKALPGKSEDGQITGLLKEATLKASSGELHTAAILYQEIGLLYERLKPAVQSNMYPRIARLCEFMDIGYAHQLIADIGQKLDQGDLRAAHADYQGLQNLYERVPEYEKPAVFERIVELANRLRHAGGSA